MSLFHEVTGLEPVIPLKTPRTRISFNILLYVRGVNVKTCISSIQPTCYSTALFASVP